MAKGNPNDASMSVGFVAKVLDPNTNTYKPIYTAPDATNSVRGDVYLSDVFDTKGNIVDTSSAATGVVAATPLALKRLSDRISAGQLTDADKVSKTDTAVQSIASNLTPTTNNSQELGSASLKWKNIYATTFTGALSGNATTASTLKTPREISIKNGTAAISKITFDGGSDQQFVLSELDASTITKGTLALAVIPKSAQERLVVVADKKARLALTTASVQMGDVVQEQDTGLMYYVVNDAKLGEEDSYKEFTAGRAASATEAGKLSSNYTIRTNLASETAVGFNGTKNIEPGVTGTLPLGHGGTGLALTKNPSMLTDLGSTTATNVFAADPRPGITGTLTIGHGGTGKTNAAEAWTALGGGSVGKLNTGTSTTTYLRNDGQWATPPDTNTDTKVKQTNNTSETAYPILLKNGTGTGEITSSTLFNSAVTITPSTGTITAKTFSGAVSGNASSATTATTATKLANAQTISLTGNVTGSASFTGDTACSISTTIANSAVGTAKIANDAVTLAKLGSDVGTVSVGATKPTDNNVIWWIDTSKD